MGQRSDHGGFSALRLCLWFDNPALPSASPGKPGSSLHRLTLRVGSATVASMVPGRQPLRAPKEGTHDLHLRAETYVRILDRDATVDDYARYSIAMHGFHAPLEAAFARDAALEKAGFAAATRRKSPLVHRDLSALGTPSAGDTLPSCAGLPVPHSLAHQIGIAYVIEGSTLGGNYLLSRLSPGAARVAS